MFTLITCFNHYSNFNESFNNYWAFIMYNINNTKYITFNNALIKLLDSQLIT